MPASLDHADHLAQLRAAVAGFHAVLATGDLRAPVPSCPGWDLQALAGHLGRIHRWATTALVDGRSAEDEAEVPGGREALLDWFDLGAATLVQTLERVGPLAPSWTFDPDQPTAAFWFRRQAHETTVHRWDAELSQGRPTPLDVALCLDGVDEAVGFFHPRQVRLGRVPAPTRSISLVATPGELRWDVTGADPRPAATVRGPAEALLLLVWGRTDLADPRLELSGDLEAAAAVLTDRFTP